MGKRSAFERVDRDFYPTPYAATLPLKDHLPSKFTFYEPCAGDARLVKHIESFGGSCLLASDIEPQSSEVTIQDAFDLEVESDNEGFIITNPPWNRKILHPMIEYFSTLVPTWLLFDADWMHTKQSIPYIPKLQKIVSVGRVKWIEGSASVGKDNCCWYLFHPTPTDTVEFFGREYNNNGE